MLPAILAQVVYLGLLVRPVHGEHLLVDPVVTAAPEYPSFADGLDRRQQGEDFVAWWPDNSSC